ncbi:hypothetical protein OAS92_04105 [Candidatus Pelagibacter sp.]|nr:hypothetical protein [Candidatus Pelagibacter sp.]
MKKILGIIVLSLLLSGNAYAEKIVDMTNSIWKDTKGQYFCQIAGKCKYKYNFFEGGNCTYSYWDLIYTTDDGCTWEQKGNKVLMEKWEGHCLEGIISSRTISWHNIHCESGRVLKKSKKKLSRAKFIEKYLDDSNNQNSVQIIKTSSLMDKKNTCKEIGFSPKTDPFANCVLRLMEIEEARSINKVSTNSQKEIAAAQSLIEQEIAKEGRDQEAWKVLLGMLGTTGSTSSSGGLFSPSAVSCNKTGESTSGTNKICYYNCMGSTKTINVGSMQFCPININK